MVLFYFLLFTDIIMVSWEFRYNGSYAKKIDFNLECFLRCSFFLSFAVKDHVFRLIIFGYLKLR